LSALFATVKAHADSKGGPNMMKIMTTKTAQRTNTASGFAIRTACFVGVVA
jgi:hypothetical protein